ncbi:MAG: PQQ-dependent sugar dehydrogenase [Fimbriimonadaceae bacterium]|nr:PQQ-dependent sugar dehydrogenase [Chitinophagales bacterium]
MKNIILILLISFPLFQNKIFSQPQIALEFHASGFDEPVGIVSAGDERLFIVERKGKIKILYPDGTNSVFLDISALVESGFVEQGLLGLAFHPDYFTNGYFYVNYINLDDDTRISRFHVSVSDSNVADTSSEFNILAIEQPALNHNGGDLHFGPDGYLYCALGNGGGPSNSNAQDTTNLLGKILRIDVDIATPYAAPSENPFFDGAGKDELWNFGLRNPWRFSFDRLTGDMFIADVGGALHEEINFQPASSTGGENYGWNCYEGNLLVNPSLCLAGSTLTFPVFDYLHDNAIGGFAVTGGYVYRGNDYPGMNGYYIFCDYISGNFWSMRQITADSFSTNFHGYLEDRIASFGENNNGELFACEKTTGNIYKIIDQCSNFNLSFTVTHASAATINNGAVDLTINNGTAPFSIVWSNGATTEDITGLAAGNYTATVIDANGCLATGMATLINNCSEATGITISSITTSSVTINWNDTGAPNYKVLYFKAGSAPSLINTTSASVTLTGLTPASNYVFKIRNKCPGAPGNFTAGGNFTTLPARENSFVESEVHIYPNPNTGSFKISNHMLVKTFSVYDVTGNYLQSSAAESENIDLSNYNNGIYLMSFELQNGIVINEKVIIQH